MTKYKTYIYEKMREGDSENGYSFLCATFIAVFKLS